MAKEVLKEKWFWTIVFSLILIICIPLVVVWVILILPYPLNFILTVMIFIAWGVAAGYKDWIMSKKEEEKKG